MKWIGVDAMRYVRRALVAFWFISSFTTYGCSKAGVSKACASNPGQVNGMMHSQHIIPEQAKRPGPPVEATDVVRRGIRSRASAATRLGRV